jgi:hypothetical protein
MRMAASAAAGDSSTHPSISITKVDQSGVEAGKATIASVDSGGYKYSAVTTIDTHGEWGLSHPQPTDRLNTR